MARKPQYFESFDTPLHQEWKHDRRLRNRVPVEHGDRGCVGLAALFDAAPERYAHHGVRVLAPNDLLRWVALRDVPPGHFPGCKVLDRRPVAWASLARAELRYGLPVLDFGRHPLQPAWDFRSFPVPAAVVAAGRRGRGRPETLDPERFPREFLVLNALSSAMTRFALFGTDDRGRPVRSPWFRCRPKGQETECRPYRVRPLRPSLTPRPMLAFALNQVDELCHALTHGCGGGEPATTVECAACGAAVDLRSLGRHGEGAVEVLDDGDRLAATCPHCRQYRVWLLEDLTSGRARRPTSPALRKEFTDAVADGLPLHATEPCTYLGPVAASPDEREAAHVRVAGVVGHRFRSGIDGRTWTVHLPATARLLVHPGQRLQSDQRWAWGLDVPEMWHRRPKAERVRDLTGACGGNANLTLLRSAWFHAQGVRLPEDPGHVLFPADLVAPACADVRPARLWWDLAGCVDQGGGFLPEAEAFVLRPVRLNRWDQLSFALPGEVRVDAAVGDPRFRAGPAETVVVTHADRLSTRPKAHHHTAAAEVAAA